MSEDIIVIIHHSFAFTPPYASFSSIHLFEDIIMSRIYWFYLNTYLYIIYLLKVENCRGTNGPWKWRFISFVDLFCNIIWNVGAVAKRWIFVASCRGGCDLLTVKVSVWPIDICTWSGWLHVTFMSVTCTNNTGEIKERSKVKKKT